MVGINEIKCKRYAQQRSKARCFFLYISIPRMSAKRSTKNYWPAARDVLAFV